MAAQQQSLSVTLAGVIGKGATLTLVDGTQVRGLVYAVDVENNHVTVCKPVDGGDDDDAGGRRMRPCLVFVHAIQSVAQESTPSGPLSNLSDLELVRRPLAGGGGPPSRAHDPERLRRLCALLESYQIPFDVHLRRAPSDAGWLPFLEVFGALRIESPYDAGACACVNELVLSRVQALVAQLDAGQEPETTASAVREARAAHSTSAVQTAYL